MNDSDNKNYEVAFWGTRGTLPVSGAPFARTGGNTNCIEITCGNHTVIFDAGTGIRALGSKMTTMNPDQEIHLLLTHAHYDHVEGIPFFAPFFMKPNNINVYCGKLDGAKDTQSIVQELMRRPFFPVGQEVFSANINYHDVGAGDCFNLSDEIRISTTPLNHPGGSTGYRLDFAGKSYAYITDTEHTPGTHDENILKLIDNVDAFSYDCSLIDKELPDFQGYGHSTFEEGMRLCKLANAGCMKATHHMPFRNDDELNQIEKMMQQENPNHAIAREGDIIKS